MHFPKLICAGILASLTTASAHSQIGIGDFTFFEPGELAPIEVAVSPTTQKYEHLFFAEINRTRVERGLKPLVWNDDIAAVAKFHSVNMATQNFFGHRDRLGFSVAERADAQGLRKWRMIGENLAYCNGFRDPVSTTLGAWLESKGHRKNLLRRKWQETGIGVAMDARGRIYVTQVFLKRK